MENLALNTIVYISLFLIPGLLFRKFYYRGEFTKQFSQGNLMERTLWTIFFSIVMLFLSTFHVYVLILLFNYLKLNVLNTIDYTSVKSIFDKIKNNNLPDSETIRKTYKDFIILVTSIYFFSVAYALIIHYFITKFKIDVYNNIFRFKNYWHYYFNGKINNRINYKEQKLLYTIADVLVNDGKRLILYTGKVIDYYIDSSNNKIDSIFLMDSKKRIENCDNQISTNENSNFIKGNILHLQQPYIININLTYITLKKNLKKQKIILFNIISIIYIIINLILLGSLAFDIFSISFLKKIFFTITTFFFLKKIINYFQLLIFEPKKIDHPIINLFTSVFFLINYLWIFNTFNWYWIVTIFVIYFIILIILLNRNKEIVLEKMKEFFEEVD